MELQEYRKEIDSIDRQIVALFEERMNVAEKIALFKQANGLPVLDTSREQQKLDAVASLVPEESGDAVRELYIKIMELSRARQSALIKH